MPPLKSPGPDGFPTKFFKDYWDIVGPQTIEFVHEFFRFGTFSKEINQTFMVLIPKRPNANCFDEFRPISLCNTSYKIIAKLLANRLCMVLDKIISPNQSTFVQGRWIVENSIIANELFFELNKRQGNSAYVGVKCDMSKAYDRLEWSFVLKVMRCIGFNHHFCKMILCCLSSVNFQLLLNDGLTKTFYPKRGLRQGNRLSPYLFIIGAEVLTRILLLEESKGNLNGFSFSCEGPSISHLMYADDLLIFPKADQRNRDTVIDAIDKYCKWSGQRINVSKSKLFFSKNCSARCREDFLQVLGFDEMSGEEKFLGNPIIFNGRRSSDFDFVIDKICSRLEGWRANLLSQAARMTLIKSVLASIPIYTMSTFLLPRKTTDRIDSIVRKFWWTGQCKEGRFLSLKAWDCLCKPKACGGLGFKRAKDINFCLLAKLGWFLASGTVSLWTSVINAKYCRNAGFLSTSLPYRASPVARGIWATRDFITDNSVWIGGHNSFIDFWCQQWLCGDGPILHKGVINPLIKNLNLVSDLVDIDSSVWNVRMVEDVFVPDAASMIISSDRNVFPVVDIACWKSSKDGSFSLKAAYWDYNKSRFAEKDNLCEKIWLAKIHERFKVFLWKLCQDALPFGSKLQSILGKPLGSCYLCGCKEKDTAEHFISGCLITRRLWFSSHWGLRLYALSSLNGRDSVAWLLHPPFQHLLNSQELYSFFLYAYHNGIPVEFKLLQKNIETCFSEHEKVRTVENERPDSGLGVVDYIWGLPRPGRVQGFVDFASDREMGAMAVVLFDASGSVMAFGAKKVVVHDVFQGELEALLFGVTLALDMQIERVDFHSDNSMLVKGLMDRNSPSWRSHFSFAKLYDLLLSFDCSVSWISRVLNKAAHTLARWGLSHSCNGLLRFWEVSPHVLTKLCILS
ncbi:uncharacterized protein LOC115695305 [Cannabis sativa]|uniref:uncharacterized protein LOC115695305 n=1 Tax=Cannabis sativa TaxID=3483 RepID=UPI0011DFE882|nr:uncharacterized protein LOC115695305 [Cannabis sativa]